MNDADIRQLITRKSETANLDYKEGFAWTQANRDKKYELARELLAMATASRYPCPLVLAPRSAAWRGSWAANDYPQTPEGSSMMDDKIGEGSGKVIGTRVLPAEGGRYVKMEITIQTQATDLGRKGIDTGTYVAYERIPGQVYGEGQGIFETEDGEGVIWNGMGVGTPTGQGMGMKWSAACTYQTNSKKLARLNGIVGMVEHETDAEGNAEVRAWEWKAG